MNRCVWLQLKQIRAESILCQLLWEKKDYKMKLKRLDATEETCLTHMSEIALCCLDALLLSTVQSRAVRCRDDLVTLAATMCHGLPWLRETGHLCNLCRVCPDSSHDWSQNWSHESHGNLWSQPSCTDEDLVNLNEFGPRKLDETSPKRETNWNTDPPIHSRIRSIYPGFLQDLKV